ncbi:MAG: glucose-6-phosphate dehydrogenase [Acidobacteriota bacterium]
MTTAVQGRPALPGSDGPTLDPCVLVLFGASGDLTKRLLMPALHGLAAEGDLPERFAIVGFALDELSTEDFRARMTEAVEELSPWGDVSPTAWSELVTKLHYVPGRFDSHEDYGRLAGVLTQLDEELETDGNVLFYLATPPPFFGTIAEALAETGLGGRSPEHLGHGFKRLIVEKPFGHDLASAVELDQRLQAHWDESQVFRIDHYLGKETVQNLLAFRFANGMFEPIWNKAHVDHVQLTIAETVGVEGRGGYYDKAGALRDMLQNHALQVIALLGMEPPSSFQADAIRNEKAKLLEAVRIMGPDEVAGSAVRAQYVAGQRPDGTDLPGYRDEPGVADDSRTETFAALRLFVDNWRWEGVPFYVRSGKRLSKKETTAVVQFKKAPEVLFRGTPAREDLDANQLVFHLQPDQGIELRFQAKTPGHALGLQTVGMRFHYDEAFHAPRGTGYETLIHHCLAGDATPFSRSDLLQASWRIVQPVLDAWSDPETPEPTCYPAASWGPKAASELIEQDGRRWLEVVQRNVLQSVPLFKECDQIFLDALSLMLQPRVCQAEETVIQAGETGQEMYLVNRGELEVVDPYGQVVDTLRTGSFFGEIALLLSRPRTATVRAKRASDLFVLEKQDFAKVLREHPRFAEVIRDVARRRYDLVAEADDLILPG